MVKYSANNYEAIRLQMTNNYYQDVFSMNSGILSLDFNTKVPFERVDDLLASSPQSIGLFLV